MILLALNCESLNSSHSIFKMHNNAFSHFDHTQNTSTDTDRCDEFDSIDACKPTISKYKIQPNTFFQVYCTI